MTDTGRNEGQIGGREGQIDKGFKEGRKQASEGEEQDGGVTSKRAVERRGEEGRGEQRREGV